ncbi:MAG: SIS domain-containing protein [Deltaproteobacteria bacterium]|nr:SIS domain-containing protein [Deltaproteobacteria bacterium]
MKEAIASYLDTLEKCLRDIQVTDVEKHAFGVVEGVEQAARLIDARISAGNKLMFIGNGASAAISSHQATDFWKAGGMRAIAFNDASLLTCISNDFGYRHVFEKPIEMFGDEGDVLVAISSSGQSENILRGVEAGRAKGCEILTLSGFVSENPLRGTGSLNFYVSSNSYGHVEIVHHAICHCILDSIMENRRKG